MCFKKICGVEKYGVSKKIPAGTGSINLTLIARK